MHSYTPNPQNKDATLESELPEEYKKTLNVSAVKLFLQNEIIAFKHVNIHGTDVMLDDTGSEFLYKIDDKDFEIQTRTSAFDYDVKSTVYTIKNIEIIASAKKVTIYYDLEHIVTTNIESFKEVEKKFEKGLGELTTYQEKLAYIEQWNDEAQQNTTNPTGPNQFRYSLNTGSNGISANVLQNVYVDYAVKDYNTVEKVETKRVKREVPTSAQLSNNGNDDRLYLDNYNTVINKRQQKVISNRLVNDNASKIIEVGIVIGLVVNLLTWSFSHIANTTKQYNKEYIMFKDDSYTIIKNTKD